MTVYTAKLRQGYLQPRRLGDNFAFAPDKLWEIARQKPAFSLDFTRRSIVDQIGGLSGAFTRPSTPQLAWDGTQFVSYAADQPAWAVGPNGLWGLQMAPGAANAIRDNSAAAAVVGTPGTLPLGMSVSATGTTSSITAKGVEDGISYFDVRFQGTTTGTSIQIRLEGSNTISFAQNQISTVSVFWKLVGGAWPVGSPALNGGLSANVYNAAVSYLADSANTSLPDIAHGSWTRQSRQVTTAQATAAWIRPYLFITCNNAQAVDFTIRIGLPQFEGTLAVPSPAETPPIITAGAPVTRTADAFAFGPGAAFDSWYNQAGGVWYGMVSLSSVIANTSRAVVGLNDNTSNNVAYLRCQESSGAAIDNFQARSAGAGQAFISSGVTVSAGVKKMAARISLDNFAISSDGSMPVMDTLGALPVAMNRAAIGALPSGSENLNAIIHRLDYYPPGPAADRIRQLSGAVL